MEVQDGDCHQTALLFARNELARPPSCSLIYIAPRSVDSWAASLDFGDVDHLVMATRRVRDAERRCGLTSGPHVRLLECQGREEVPTRPAGGDWGLDWRS